MLSHNIDQHLLDLVWSLWIELGVSGNLQHHHNCLIDLEVLIILTAAVADIDPRLRDEALDWCSKHHHFVSISRLKALLKTHTVLNKTFSTFAATLNTTCDAKWPILLPSPPSKFKPSGKSMPPRLENPSLLNLRIRALFGVGARADLITFFLTQKREEFIASDLTTIGYAKSNLVSMLDGFVQSGIFEYFITRNVRYYRFTRQEQMAELIGPLPQIIPSWRQFLDILIPLRECIQRTENKSSESKLIEAQNILKKFENILLQLNLTPPSFDADVHHSWHLFSEWILKVVRSYAECTFGKAFTTHEVSDAARRIENQFKGLYNNIDSLKTISNEHTRKSLFDNYKRSFKRHLDNYLPRLQEEDQKQISKFRDQLLLMDLEDFNPASQQQLLIRVAAKLAKYFSE